MKYTILQLILTANALTIVAQPVIERGAVARGSEDFLVPPGLLCLLVRRAMHPGETWEIEADDEGRVRSVSRDGVTIGE